ncbi:MAG: ATP-binding protein [Acidimicrobiia bacterium]|nr:ATP-binding protein [Acidimicrobiia bacterium]MYB25780.1 ATP-binding protein [Acidimicrobiia bacterium]MYE67811.1 ATP-binding protein [Acidimicrobiia bacterium]MYJ13406.1 ATP-binding protein [Acidimicrobiia bacterium]
MLTPHGYRPRVADAEVERALRASPAVLIEGPRACGKTWTGRRHARSEVPFDSVFAHRLAAQVAPMEVLDGPVPRLLDEWQLAPDVWNAMRRACDDRGRKGQFVLTGSADPPDATTRHTGTGRIMRVRMRPMSLYESGESSGRVSLGELLEGGSASSPESPGGLRDLVAVACRGGWPGLLDDAPEDAQRQIRAYLDEICRTDISRVDGIGRDPAGVRRLLASLARNVATEATLKTLAADLAGGEGTLHPTTVKSYLSALSRLFVVEDLPAWRPHLRSRAALRSAPKRFFADPSLAVASLRSTAGELMADLNYFGLVFESLVRRDLSVYAQAIGWEVSHYRDSAGLEADMVLTSLDYRGWAAVEVKLGGVALVEQGAATLRKLRQRIDIDRMGEPRKLVVITAGGYGFEYPDGVAVVPITALAP